MATAPTITLALREATLWRGMAHMPAGQMVDLGDIAVVSHTRKGIECYLYKVEQRMTLPYPADDQWVLDKHDHVRIGGADGVLRMTFAPA